jgi:hypothetical protein
MTKQKSVEAVNTQCQCTPVPALDEPVYARLFGTMAALMDLLDNLKNYSVEQDYDGLELVNLLISVPRAEKDRLASLCTTHKVGIGGPYQPCA